MSDEAKQNLERAAVTEIRHLEGTTDTTYPGRNGRWWYEGWAAKGLCDREHDWLNKKARPCGECRAATAIACDQLDRSLAAASLVETPRTK